MWTGFDVDLSGSTLFATLRAACAEAWGTYVSHRFVREIADGSLPEPCFRRYLEQDYLFLIHFARAYGLAVYKSDSVEDLRQASAGLAAIVDRELSLHVSYCRKWGVDERALADAPEFDATMAYTRYVLERGLAGDILDLQVALAPCIVGYAEIGQRLAESAGPDAPNPYREWIEMYAGADYQAVAAAHVAHMDRLMERRGGPGRLPSLITTFDQATRLEAAFWDMGLAAG